MENTELLSFNESLKGLQNACINVGGQLFVIGFAARQLSKEINRDRKPY